MTKSFRKPPIVEFSLAVQFAPLSKLTNGHLGLFWHEIRESGWSIASDELAIADQFEVFGQEPRWITHGLKFSTSPAVGRLSLTNDDRDRVLHMQPTRFMLSWRKTDQMKPSYKTLISEFLAEFRRFRDFVASHSLGEIQSNQWEITYVDSFEKGTLWQSAAEWSEILPGLFGRLFDTAGLDLQLERRTAQWSYEIHPRKARLHIVAQLGRLLDSSLESLLLTLTARGPLDSDDQGTLLEGLNLGHEKSVEAFLRLVHPSLLSTWEPI